MEKKKNPNKNVQMHIFVGIFLLFYCTVYIQMLVWLYLEVSAIMICIHPPKNAFPITAQLLKEGFNGKGFWKQYSRCCFKLEAA